MNLPKSGRGRPRKYGRQSRPITVTLPEDVIGRLTAVDADLGRAIVTLTERRGTQRVRAIRPAELTTYGNHAVIVVTPAKALKRLDGVQLVPIGNGRALISLEQPRSTADLELEVRDALEQAEGVERQALAALADILRQARASKKVEIKERTIIVIAARRQRRAQ
jgi:hypothetical protein